MVSDLSKLDFNGLGNMSAIMAGLEEAVREKETRDLSARLYKNIEEHINLLYDSLGSDEWLSVDLLCENGQRFRVTDIKAIHPNALVVVCLDEKNEACAVFTHMDMLQLLMKKEKITPGNDSATKRRIGFSTD
jgi:hypothetical protein